MLAEIAQLGGLDERGRRRRNEYLPPVTGSGDPRGAVDVGSHVALVRQQRRASVNAHPHRQLELLLRLAGGAERAGSGREGDKERVTLRVDLDAAVPLERVPQDAAMPGQHSRVVIRAELVQEARRPLDVREEKGDGAGRQVEHGTNNGGRPHAWRQSRVAQRQASDFLARPCGRKHAHRSETASGSIIPEHWPRRVSGADAQRVESGQEPWQLRLGVGADASKEIERPAMVAEDDLSPGSREAFD